ncbi:DUF2635 domain-containing protein [Haemophilus sputorum]|uniref:DUF2635 domain-containing protein n=1 Tax=Haemophilus sputorum TaxID=1078480 RepID=A0A369YL80_9PAST|nr:DUF2635 domain-containing protein [Haemophilus sputorum]RDE72676.1 DUF2635 domain-containing protein [Haemophilus sputorum]
MKVIATKGVRVPMEDAPHQYITENEVVEVEATTYYLRRIADGDLLVDKAQAVKKVEKNANNGGDK